MFIAPIHPVEETHRLCESAVLDNPSIVVRDLVDRRDFHEGSDEPLIERRRSPGDGVQRREITVPSKSTVFHFQQAQHNEFRIKRNQISVLRVDQLLGVFQMLSANSYAVFCLKKFVDEPSCQVVGRGGLLHFQTSSLDCLNKGTGLMLGTRIEWSVIL